MKSTMFKAIVRASLLTIGATVMIAAVPVAQAHDAYDAGPRAEYRGPFHDGYGRDHEARRDGWRDSRDWRHREHERAERIRYEQWRHHEWREHHEGWRGW